MPQPTILDLLSSIFGISYVSARHDGEILSFAMHEAANPFIEIARRFEGTPPAQRREQITHAVQQVLPFVGTAGLAVEAYAPTRVVVRLENRRRVQNHLEGLHAAAVALLAETATGLVAALNVPAGSVPVLRTLHVDYRRRTVAPLRAEAALSAEEAARIQSRPVGKIDVPVRLTGADERAPVEAALKWAWLPERRLG